MNIVRSAALLLAVTISGCAQVPTSAPPVAYAHPVFAQPFTCMEHWAGNLNSLGDALGTDCLIQELVEFDGKTWLHAYRGDGARNQDWFGWRKDVLSPCTCTVVRLVENPTSNAPGVLGKPPASYIDLLQSDGTHFLLAHVAEVRVRQGESVLAGQVLARVGNNGYSRNPHVHVGAWRDGKPLQIRFDLEAAGRLFE